MFGSFFLVFANLLTDVELNLLEKIHEHPQIVRCFWRSKMESFICCVANRHGSIEIHPRVSDRSEVVSGDGRVTKNVHLQDPRPTNLISIGMFPENSGFSPQIIHFS